MWGVSKIVERLKICRTRVWQCCRSDLFIGQKCNKYYQCFKLLPTSVCPLSKVNLQTEDSLAQHHVTSSSSGSVVVQQGGANHQHHRLATRLDETPRLSIRIDIWVLYLSNSTKSSKNSETAPPACHKVATQTNTITSPAISFI